MSTTGWEAGSGSPLRLARRGLRRALGLFGRTRRWAADLRAQADRARGAARFRDAAILYQASARLHPSPSTLIQAGHMFKEAGDSAAAEPLYLAALRLLPDDTDLALQLGHFYKVAGRADDAEIWYRRALSLKPGWSDPSRELAALDALGGGIAGASDGAGPESSVIPELLGRAAPIEPVDTIEIARLGGPPAGGAHGLAPVVRGVEAIRGYCRSGRRIRTVELLLDGETMRIEPVTGFALGNGVDKYVFNIWQDFAAVAQGPHTIELRMVDEAGGVRRRQQRVMVLPPLREADHPDADSVLDGAGEAADPAPAIRARASMVRPARARLFAERPRSVLVARADQLGDMVVSIPALTRLRAMLPEASIIGLVTSANADLARSLGLFDDVVLTPWADTPHAPRSVVDADAQHRLRERLAGYHFDVAIDLSVSGNSRPLLLLSGAPVLIGFDDREWPWLSVGQDGGSHDVRTGREMAPHSAKLVALVERLGTLLDSGSRIVPRASAAQPALGLSGRPYAVLHDGARYAFARWPGYAALIAMLLERTDLDIVVLRDAPEPEGAGRVRVLGGPLPFDRFDALLAGAAVFVGNDSGPKHLAALRGTPVVSIHSARIDWREWAQEQTGLVVSRRVPCAGCGIVDERDCGKDYACIVDIAPEEVLAAVSALLPPARLVPPRSG